MDASGRQSTQPSNHSLQCLHKLQPSAFLHTALGVVDSLCVSSSTPASILLSAKLILSNGIVRNGCLLTSNASPQPSRLNSPWTLRLPLKIHRCRSRQSYILHHVVKCQSISAENAPPARTATVLRSDKLYARLTILPEITSLSENLIACVVASSPRPPRAPGLL